MDVSPMVYRSETGQYQVDPTSLEMSERDSPIRKIVREEVEFFIMKLKSRLNATLPESDLNDEGLAIKDEVRFALKKYIGAKTGKVAVSFVKKPNSWNGFMRENYATKVAELTSQGDGPEGMTSYVYGISGDPDPQEFFKQVVHMVRDDYNELSPSERKSYSSVVLHTAPGDAIEPNSTTLRKRKSALVKNMKDTVTACVSFQLI
jgi:hypothetical protein